MCLLKTEWLQSRIKCEIQKKTNSISSLNHIINNYDNQMKDLLQIVTTIEHNAKAMSDIFDDVKENTEYELKTMKVETKDLMNAFNTTLLDWTKR